MSGYHQQERSNGVQDVYNLKSEHGVSSKSAWASCLTNQVFPSKTAPNRKTAGQSARICLTQSELAGMMRSRAAELNLYRENLE